MTNNEVLDIVNDNGSSLECDICSAHICMMYDFDLNGSHFVCDDCMKTHRPAPKTDEVTAG